MAEKRTDLWLLIIPSLIFIALYVPVWWSDYLYTDEAVQLWHYGKEPGFKMFAPQGRYVTEKLFHFLFGKAQLIRDVRYIRIVSFLGWLATLPLWYFLLKKIFVRERLNPLLAFSTVLFIVCSPTVSIAVVWASCLELFLANVCGFLSGYFTYKGITTFNGRIQVSATSVLLSAVFGVVSLFTYQNGFGFFFLPFIILALSPARNMRHITIGIAVSVLICALYFLLFQYSLKAEGLAASNRTSLYIAPWGKLWFFFTRPMSSAFHYTYLFNEKEYTGYIIYAVLFGSWIMLFLLRHKEIVLQQRIKYLAVLLLLLIGTYFPSLLVRENYASNRTLLALNTAVWVLTAEMVFHYLYTRNAKRLVAALISFLFCWNAWYNVTHLFLKPVIHEYVQLRSYLEQQYKPGVTTIYFMRPQEDFFIQQYGTTRSWDEFGVPSLFFSWVPEYFVRQIVFEKTGDRNVAKALIIKDWSEEGAIDSSSQNYAPDTLFVAAEKIMATHK